MEYIVRRWRKVSECKPVIGQLVLVHFADGRQTMLYGYPLEGQPQDTDDYYWVAVSGQQSPAPEFWFDEQPIHDGVCDTRW